MKVHEIITMNLIILMPVFLHAEQEKQGSLFRLRNNFHTLYQEVI